MDSTTRTRTITTCSTDCSITTICLHTTSSKINFNSKYCGNPTTTATTCTVPIIIAGRTRMSTVRQKSSFTTQSIASHKNGATSTSTSTIIQCGIITISTNNSIHLHSFRTNPHNTTTTSSLVVPASTSCTHFCRKSCIAIRTVIIQVQRFLGLTTNTSMSSSIPTIF